MKEKDLLETLVEQISELLEMVRTKSISNDTLPPDILLQISKLGKDIERLKKLNNQVMEQNKIDTTGKDLNPREKGLVEKIKKMKQEAMDLKSRYEFSLIAEKNKTVGKPFTSQKKSENEKKSSGYKKKLKAIGSKKNWNRL